MLFEDSDALAPELEVLAELGPDDDLLLAEIELGEEAAQFANSSLGQLLIGRANQIILEQTRMLKSTLPWRRRRIQQLQNEIQVAEMFKLWLLEAVQNGRIALGEMTKRQEMRDE